MGTLNDLAAEIHKTAVAHGWWDPQCEHELARVWGDIDVAWCEPCGAFSKDGGISWQVPEVSADRNFGEVIALIHSEYSEALEEWRDGKGMLYYNEDNPSKPEGVGIELVDGIIRAFDWMARKGLDIDYLIRLKMEYNESRPYRHGGKLA